jgi:hypothetical protein
MKFYDIELIDINEQVENFVFEKIAESDLNLLLTSYKEKKDFLEFECSDGKVILESKFFRGIMYTPHILKQKNIIEETLENAEEIGKITVNKKKVKG